MPRPTLDDDRDRQLRALIQSLRAAPPPVEIAAQRDRLLERMFGIEPGPVQANTDMGPKTSE